MRTRSSVLLLAVVTAIVTLFTYTEARAFANGDGTCSAGELAAFECAQFGPGNVIEFMGASSGTCNISGGTTPPTAPAVVPCTVYSYKYTGGTTNQIVVGIPERLTKVVNDAIPAETRCDQYITNGAGDPTTSFGKGLTSLGVCRITPNLGSSTTFTIATDPSFIDNTVPLDWQVRKSKTEVFQASLVGPVTTQIAIASTGETLTTADGTTITYRIVGGLVEITNCISPDLTSCLSTARVLTLGQTQLCVENVGATQPSPAFPTSPSFTCDVVTFVDGNPNFQVGPNSTCVKYVGRTPVAYAC